MHLDLGLLDTNMFRFECEQVAPHAAVQWLCEAVCSTDIYSGLQSMKDGLCSGL